MLSVLWDLQPEEVEDILEEFVNKSLLFVDTHNKPHLYYLHDLQLDFLVEQNRNQLEVGLALHFELASSDQANSAETPCLLLCGRSFYNNCCLMNVAEMKTL